MEGVAGRLPRLVLLRRGELGADVDDEVTYQDDIVLQLRRAAVWTMLNGQRHMLDHAADEIERLRLTAAEREAVQVARDAYADDDGNAECEQIAAVLSRLLERTK